MATIIKPKRSRNLGVVPTTAQLADGEIAVNIPDQRIYIRDGANIKIIAQAPTGLTAQWTYLDYAGLASAELSADGISIGLSVQKRYLANTSLGSFELNLPISSLNAGDSVEVADPANYWSTNAIKVNSTVGHQIEDQIGNVENTPFWLDVSGAHIFFLWTGTRWSVIR
jgi:hypothetical protein